MKQITIHTQHRKVKTTNKGDYQQTPFQLLSDFFEAASFLRTISSTQSLYI
jgi:hypothetical protein